MKLTLKRVFRAAGINSNVIFLFIASFVLRTSYILWKGSWLAGDSHDYLNIAKNIAFFFSFSFGKDGSALTATAFRPPIYPLLISPFYRTGYPIESILLIQIILGSATVSLAYLLAKRHFGVRIATVGALALMIEPFTIHYTSGVMTETLFTFLVVLGVYLIDKKNWVFAGTVFGLAALTRPAIVFFLVGLVFLSIFSVWSSRRRAFFTVLIVAAATVSIWSVRNAIVFKEFIPISSTGYGYILLCGTLDVPMLSDEGWNIVKNDSAIKQRLKNIKRGWTESAADRELFREALRRILSNPATWLRVRVKQYIRLYIDSAPYILGRSNMRIGDAIQNGNWLFVAFKFLLVGRSFIAVGLALIAIFLLRNKLDKLIHIFLFPVAMMLIHIPLWTENRYLLPIVPFLCILGAYTLTIAFDKVRSNFPLKM